MSGRDDDGDRGFDLPDALLRSPIHAPVQIPDAGVTFSYSPIQQVRLAAGEAVNLGNQGARQQIADRIAAGELVELEVDFRAYQQVDGERNANFVRFKPAILRRLARSFAGRPLLRDHDDRHLDARGGTITASQAVKIDGGLAFDMTAKIAAPWAVLGVVRGTLDRFSIGWAHGGRATILCSHCGCPVFTECHHMPGDRLEPEGDADGEAPGVIEWIFTEAEGVEVSAVSVPAVQGTGISEIRAALSRSAALYAAPNPGTMPRGADEMNLTKIAEQLGLPADASPEAVLAAIKAVRENAAAAGAEVEALRASQTELEQRVTILSERERERTVEALFAEFADRLPRARDAEGRPAQSSAEAELRKLAATDPDSARRILASLPRLAAAGSMQSIPPDLHQPAAPSERPAQLPSGAAWDPILARQLDELDISPEEYAAHGPHAGPALSVREIHRQEKARRDGGRRVH